LRRAGGQGPRSDDPVWGYGPRTGMRKPTPTRRVESPAIMRTLSAMLDAGAAITALPLGRLVQNRQEAKVRASIESGIKIAKDLAEIPLDSKQALTRKIELALENDLDSLNRIIEARNQEKRRNLPSLAVAVFMAGTLTIPLWFLWRPTTPLSWSIFLFLGFAAAILLLVGGFAYFNPPERTNESGKSEGT